MDLTKLNNRFYQKDYYMDICPLLFRLSQRAKSGR